MHSSPTTGSGWADTSVGRCGCGCGARTALAKSSDPRTGRVKGAPRRYLPGHHRRRRVRYIEFWAGHTSACWIWVLARDRQGYGRVANRHGGSTLAHRVYYERANGPIPAGSQLDHSCRMPACVNPRHLEVVTPAENVQRGRAAKLTAAQVAEIRASGETQSVLAQRYGISQPHVSRIRQRLTWRVIRAEDSGP